MCTQPFLQRYRQTDRYHYISRRGNAGITLLDNAILFIWSVPNNSPPAVYQSPCSFTSLTCRKKLTVDLIISLLTRLALGWCLLFYFVLISWNKNLLVFRFSFLKYTRKTWTDLKQQSQVLTHNTSLFSTFNYDSFLTFGLIWSVF